MKQKIVFQTQVPGSNFPTKAMQVVAKENGVESVAIEGVHRNEVVVIGENIDRIKLGTKLRKKVGCINVHTVSQIN